MAVKTRVNVRAWSETTPGGTEYYIDGNKILGTGATIPLANLADFTRGDIIVGGATQWQDLAVGVAGEYVGTDGTDVLWRGAHPDNGFVNRTDSSLAMSTTNLRIAPTGAGYAFYSAGKRYLKTTNQDVAISNDLTQHYVYFETDGVIKADVTPWVITSDTVPAATVFKDGANYAICDERHGYLRDRFWHQWAHDTIGTRYESGLSGTFGDTTFSIAQGIVHDEDIEHDTGGTKTACRLWYRHTGAAAMRFESNVTRPWKLGATPAPQYDNAGTLTDVGANQYFCSYVYATNDIDYPIYIVVGQAEFATVASARNDSLPATPGLLTREWKLLYRAIYRRNGASATYTEATDFRETSTGPGSSYTPASHTTLTNRDAASSHPASAITETTTIGRLMQGNATTGALEASTVVKSGAGVLTFSAGSAYTVTVAGTSAINQDVQTTASPTFANVQITNGGYTGIASDVRTVFDSTNGRIDLTLGDAGGSDEVRVVDSGGAAVVTADSDGNVGMVNLTINRTGAADGSQLIQFNMDRAWKFYTINTGASNALGMKPDTDDKFFYIQSQDRSVNYMSIFARNAGTGYVRMDCQLGFYATPAARLDIDAGAVRLAEMSAPSAPAANSVVIYAVDNGAGKTQLMALFSSGAAQQIAIQP